MDWCFTEQSGTSHTVNIKVNLVLNFQTSGVLLIFVIAGKLEEMKIESRKLKEQVEKLTPKR